MDKTLASLLTKKLRFKYVRSSRVKAKQPKNDPSIYFIEIFKKGLQQSLI